MCVTLSLSLSLFLSLSLSLFLSLSRSFALSLAACVSWALVGRTLTPPASLPPSKRPSSPPFLPANPRFVADIERFTVGFDHGANIPPTTADVLDLGGGGGGTDSSDAKSVLSRQAQGKLYVEANDYLCKHADAFGLAPATVAYDDSGGGGTPAAPGAPCWLSPILLGNGIDIFPLEVLLVEAARPPPCVPDPVRTARAWREDAKSGGGNASSALALSLSRTLSRSLALLLSRSRALVLSRSLALALLFSLLFCAFSRALSRSTLSLSHAYSSLILYLSLPPAPAQVLLRASLSGGKRLGERDDGGPPPWDGVSALDTVSYADPSYRAADGTPTAAAMHARGPTYREQGTTLRVDVRCGVSSSFVRPVDASTGRRARWCALASEAARECHAGLRVCARAVASRRE